MAELKTKINDASVADFLSAIPDAKVREDCRAITSMMQTATKAKPKMWGPSIIGFGQHRVVYPNGRELDWMVIGFSPRKQNIVLYGVHHDDELLAKLGKHSKGGAQQGSRRYHSPRGPRPGSIGWLGLAGKAL